MKEFIFENLPKTMEEFLKLEFAKMSNPFETAAMTVVALAKYEENEALSIEMLDYIRGPRKLNNYDKQFLKDRFRDNKGYIARSYFSGALPENDYTPVRTYKIIITENPYSYTQENMAKLYIQSGGADSPRPIELRLAKDGKWYLWEQLLLAGIREPKSSNPWA